MQKFWERSPEWWRLQEVCEALRVAERVLDEEDDPYWIERAKEDRDDAYVAWVKACEAFRASAAGRACARLHADPITRGVATAEEFAA